LTVFYALLGSARKKLMNNPWLLYQISFPPVHGLKGFSVVGVEHDEGTDGALVVSAGHVAKSLLKKEWKI
jgi:hypothetical protein